MYNTTNTRYLLNGGGPGSTMSDCNPRRPLAVNRKPATGFPTYRSERSLLLFFSGTSLIIYLVLFTFMPLISLLILLLIYVKQN